MLSHTNLCYCDKGIRWYFSLKTQGWTIWIHCIASSALLWFWDPFSCLKLGSAFALLRCAALLVHPVISFPPPTLWRAAWRCVLNCCSQDPAPLILTCISLLKKMTMNLCCVFPKWQGTVMAELSSTSISLVFQPLVTELPCWPPKIPWQWLLEEGTGEVGHQVSVQGTL